MPELPGAPPRAVTLSTTSAVVASPNVRRRKIILQNDGTVQVYVCRGPTAVVNAGIRLNANGGALIDEPDAYGSMYYGPWSAIAPSGTPVLLISEE